MERIAIITSFTEFNPGYSLTGIVSDQVRMLQEAGHDVSLFVCENYNDAKYPGPVGCDIQKVMPKCNLFDYQSVEDVSAEHEQTAIDTFAALVNALEGYDLVFTHDLIFTGWHLPYALGVKKASLKLPGVRGWLHWIHSIPSGQRDWWDIKSYGGNHKIIFPNKTDLIRVAEQYRGDLGDVRCIPHIKDPRSWFGFCKQTLDIIDNIPALLTADFVQVLPASVDRLSAKRVLEVMKIFANLKYCGCNVCLLIANQWATTNVHKECISNYEFYAHNCNLERRVDFAFTSTLGDYEIGLSQQAIRDLMLLSNLFIFPTREESFGLVVAEAGLSGSLLVLNRSLQMQMEISGLTGLYFDFGSYTNNFNVDNEEKYYLDIAKIIIGKAEQDNAIKSKTFFRQNNNWTRLYKKAYLPVFGEALTWGN